MLSRWWRLWNALEKESQNQNPDLIVSHFAPYGVVASQYAKNRDIPEVTHFHGPWAAEGEIEDKNPFIFQVKKFIELNAYRRGMRFIVLSRAFSNILANFGRIDQDRIDIIPPGIDFGRFNTAIPKSEARRLLGWSENKFIIFSVRRLMKRMGLDVAIQAMKEQLHQFPNSQFFIGGKGPEEENLKQLIFDLELGNNVQLLGRIPDDKLMLYYRAADLTLAPSRGWEGFGLVVAESLACGTPCIVSDTGGLPEVVENLEKELILPELNSQAIVKKMAQFRESQFGLNSDICQKYARDHFDWEKNGKKIVKSYSQVVEKAKSSFKHRVV